MLQPSTMLSVRGLREIAHALDIPLLGVVSAGEAHTFSAFQHWLDAGNAGDMTYLTELAEARCHPENVLPGVRTVIMLGIPFEALERMALKDKTSYATPRFLQHFPAETPVTPAGMGLVAEYATSGKDYHDVIRHRLKSFQKEMKLLLPGQTTRGIVDTAPFLEREFAERAGIGFVARNRMLTHPQYGSFLFLAAILTTADVHATDVHVAEDDITEENNPENAFILSPEQIQKMRQACETCGRCQKKCPTGALTDAGVDARKCISALTVEYRGEIPSELAQQIGRHVLGCDECQRACPWNRKILARRPRTFLELSPILEMNEDEFRAEFAHTPFWRSTREGLIRNAKICLKNETQPEQLQPDSPDTFDSRIDAFS